MHELPVSGGRLPSSSPLILPPPHQYETPAPPSCSLMHPGPARLRVAERSDPISRVCIPPLLVRHRLTVLTSHSSQPYQPRCLWSPFTRSAALNQDSHRAFQVLSSVLHGSPG